MRTPATRFEDLVVWQKAYHFVLAAYRLSWTFPRSETYGLSSPFRRTLRKDLRNTEKQTNSAFTTSHKVPSKNLDTIF